MITDSNEGLQKARRLLVFHLAFCLLACVGLFLFFKLGFNFKSCTFNRITGLCCLTCGATRATCELLQLHIWHSILLNPVPIMIVCFASTVIGFEIFSVIIKRYYPFKWLLQSLVLMVGVAIVYCLLRNFGFAPTPNDVLP